MAQSLLLRIVTPRAPLLETEVLEVSGPGTVGEFGVLPDHVTFLTSLEPGVLRYRTTGGEGAVAILGGFAEVRNNTVTVLADDALSGEDVPVEQVRAELSHWEQEARALSPGDAAFELTDRQRRWAEAQLAAARLAGATRLH